MEEDKYVSGKKASETLGVHQRTLYLWDKKKIIETIRTPGGKRLYNVKKYMELLEKNKTNVKNVNSKKVNIIMEGKQKIIYARVSSIQQKNDLERQIKVLKTKYPTYEVITDIGSGINMKRRGLLKIINNSIKGRVEEIVIVHRDRLCRFGYELIKYLVKEYSNGKITVLAEENKKEPKEELVNDILQIMNIFVAKINGIRKYKKIEK